MDESVFQIDSSELFAIRESNNGGEKIVEVHLRELPSFDQWQEVFDAVKGIMTPDVDVCQIRLERLEYCDSQGLGMWVTLDAAVRNHKAKCEFWVKKDSRLQQILTVTRLDQILDICLLDL